MLTITPDHEVSQPTGLSDMTEEPVDLSTNENPLGPSPRVVEAIDREARRVHRYPAREDGTLREALAAHHGHGLTPDHFVTGASASEVLEFVARAALRPGDEGLICSPTFPVYASTAAHQDARVVDVPLDPATGGHHADRILAAVTPRTRLLYICNPGNPTGIRMPAAEFTALLERIPSGIIVVADEVYYQYVEGDFPDTVEQIHAGRDVVIVHSFSKGYGMAGLRLGYGIARPELVRRFARFRLMYHLSGIALAAGIAALADQEHVTRTVALTREGRRYFAGELDRLGIRYWPSEANFVLTAPTAPDRVLARLAADGILVRAVEGPGQVPCLRISIGRPEVNRRVIEALASEEGVA